MPRKPRSKKKKSSTRRKSKYDYSKVNSQSEIHKTVSTFLVTATGAFNQVAGGATPSFGSYSFSLADLTDDSQYTTMYDFYRIDKVKIKFYPCRQTENVNSMSFGATPMLAVAIDYNDAGTPTTIAEIFEYTGVKVVQATKPLTFSLVPAVADSVYQSAITTAYTEGKHQWISTAYPTVPHFGIKFCMTNNVGPPALGVADVNFGYHITFTYYISYKGVK